MNRCIVIVASACFLVLSLPSVARAYEWKEGAEAPNEFSIGANSSTVAGTVRSRPGIALKRLKLWEFKGFNGDFDPFAVQPLDNGNVLVASRSNEVLEVARDKSLRWSYTRVADNGELNQVYTAQRLPNGNTLIVDRVADFVIEVTPQKQTVWRYGVTRNSLAPGSLMDPFHAVRLANGNTLICDTRGGRRIIEVRSSDFQASQPNLGYDAGSIVWQYGHDGIAGFAPGYLSSPRHAQRLPNGNTLIADAGDRDYTSSQVIEVTPSGQIAWAFGEGGVEATDSTHLDTPSSAWRLGNGNTLIAEEDGQRMLEVNGAGQIVDLYGPSEPMVDHDAVGRYRGIARTPSGSTLICDQDNGRVLELGYSTSGVFTSSATWLGMPGVNKVISSISVVAEVPLGTSVSLSYSLDGGPWKGSGTFIALPPGSTAKSLRYQVKLATGSKAYSPVVRTVSVVYDVAPTSTAPTTTAPPETKSGTASRGGTRGAASGGTIPATGSGGGIGDGLASLRKQSVGFSGELPAAGVAPATPEGFLSGILLKRVGSAGDGSTQERWNPSVGVGLRADGHDWRSQRGALLALAGMYSAGVAWASGAGTVSSLIRNFANTLCRRVAS